MIRAMDNERVMARQADEMPKLHCLVQHGDTIKADLVVTLNAAIVSTGRLYYFELAATSDSTAHAIAGALSENRIEALWRINGAPFTGGEWKDIDVKGPFTIRDCRLEVPRWKGRLHHVAALDSTSDLILADSDQTVWSKMRARMSCPTLESWGGALAPQFHDSGLLILATTFGIDNALTAYILSPDASERFDRLVSAYVREQGGLACRPRRGRMPLEVAA